jgi:hypothetical protein
MLFDLLGILAIQLFNTGWNESLVMKPRGLVVVSQFFLSRFFFISFVLTFQVAEILLKAGLCCAACV